MTAPILFACDCNGTAVIDITGLSRALEQGSRPVQIRSVSQLCRRQSLEFATACEGTDDIVVNCTQERAFFEEVANAKKVLAPVKYVNTRELGAWGQDGQHAGPKIAALVAMAQQGAMEPVPSVSYVSNGKIAVIGSAELVEQWCARLSSSLQVTGIVDQNIRAVEAAGLRGRSRKWALAGAQSIELSGWLGKFVARWQSTAPIDLEACVRCGACIDACPEGAISNWLQIDTEKCTGHRSCVQACSDISAIDFARSSQTQEANFDLILDLRPERAFSAHQAPQGYFSVLDHADPVLLALTLQSMVGEFEKPKFFNYRESICAHSRNEKTGCQQCIDVCSAQAISSAGKHISVNPHLCVGCGACTTVCPSGALSYAYPNVEHLGERLRTGLRTFSHAGGRDPTVVIVDEEHGIAVLESLSQGRPSRGPAQHEPLPGGGLAAHVLPIGVQHVASVGLDIWLAALAYGAGQVVVLLDGSQAPQYALALQEQANVANEILLGLGYAGRGVRILDGRDSQVIRENLGASATMSKRAAVSAVATYKLSKEKRRSMELSIEHLAKHAPTPVHVPIALPAGAPFGRVEVNTSTCTLCLACVGVCPSSALADNPDTAQLRFLERNCVQCGLCETTCPEQAIRLIPQLDLRASAKQLQVVNEARPFHCISCKKPFGTAAMVESMLTKLVGHSLFAGTALDRLKMCADCRVADMLTNKEENTIFDFKDTPISRSTKGKP